MTTEIELNSDRYGEIARLIYNKDPDIKKIDKVVLKHLEKVHVFDSDIPYVAKMYSQIEHIAAVMDGRRNLNELA